MPPQKQDYVYKDLYEVIFVYNTDIYDSKSVESLYIDFDIDSDDKRVIIVLRDSFNLKHNFGEVDIIIANIFDSKNSIRRRIVFSVNLSRYKQEFVQKENNSQKNMEDVSRIELSFRVTQYDIIIDDYIDITPIENWIRDYKIEKILRNN